MLNSLCSSRAVSHLQPIHRQWSAALSAFSAAWRARLNRAKSFVRSVALSDGGCILMMFSGPFPLGDVPPILQRSDLELSPFRGLQKTRDARRGFFVFFHAINQTSRTFFLFMTVTNTRSLLKHLLALDPCKLCVAVDPHRSRFAERL